MSAAENKPETDPQQSNDDVLDQTIPNNNQELDKINDAVEAAESSFTLNYDTEPAIQKEPDEVEDEEGRNIKQ